MSTWRIGAGRRKGSTHFMPVQEAWRDASHPLASCPLLELSHYVLNDYLVQGPWQNFSWFSASFGTCQHKQSEPHSTHMEGGRRQELAAQPGRRRKGLVRQEHLCAGDGIPLSGPLCSDLRPAVRSRPFKGCNHPRTLGCSWSPWKPAEWSQRFCRSLAIT